MGKLMSAKIIDLPMIYDHESDFDQVLRDAGKERSARALASKPENKSQAIRRALVHLGLDASASAVRTLILDQWPQFESQIRDDKNWSQNVSQNRKRAAVESGIGACPLVSDIDDVADGVRAARLLAQKIGAGADGIEGAREVLRIIEKLGSLERANQALEVWDELVRAANGDEDIAERMISVIESKFFR